MNRHSRPTRTPANLPAIHHQLNMYALAASLAGVEILAVTQAAEAKIIYTPKHLLLPFGKTFIDLNHDGRDDFYFSEYVTQGFGEVSARAVKNTSIQGDGGFASALPAGARIGGKSKFGPDKRMVSIHVSTTCTTGGYGPWANVKNRYLGLKFHIKGEVHYGWARLTEVNGKPGNCGSPFIKATLTGFAYETIPNKPIVAGKTHGKDEATLGRLAQGASGVSRPKK